MAGRKFESQWAPPDVRGELKRYGGHGVLRKEIILSVKAFSEHSPEHEVGFPLFFYGVFLFQPKFFRDLEFYWNHIT